MKYALAALTAVAFGCVAFGQAVTIPRGYHAHETVNGTIVHADSNYGSAAAHAGVLGRGWPKTGYAGQTVYVGEKTRSKTKTLTRSGSTYAAAVCPPAAAAAIVGYVVQPPPVTTTVQPPPVTKVTKQAPITIQPPDIVETTYPPAVTTTTQAAPYYVAGAPAVAAAGPVAVAAPRGRLLCPGTWIRGTARATGRVICP